MQSHSHYFASRSYPWQTRQSQRGSIAIAPYAMRGCVQPSRQSLLIKKVRSIGYGQSVPVPLRVYTFGNWKLPLDLRDYLFSKRIDEKFLFAVDIMNE